MTKLLDKIKSPADIKKLSVKDLNKLAYEIRQLIICTVADTGGHLASNLGVVELTLALYKSFNFPKDKLIWDVGHQCYTHKIITGRKNKFASLRQLGGLSGFPRREESKYDAFNVGHASTSLSAALGMAKARDLKNRKEEVIAVIGDGSLTGGLALEGLNQIGVSQSDIIVILNDNKMSISENVGAVASYLNKIISDPRVIKTRDKARDLVRKLPNRLGRIALRTGEIVEGGFKSILAPGAWFEELGFRYFGPLDGHDPAELIQTFRNIKNVKGPILLHVVTQKGKGYKHAEKDACKFHGAVPFHVKNGENKKKAKKNQTYTQVFADTTIKLADKNKKLVAITAAMPAGTGLDKFAEKYPDRFFDVGIAEGHAVTFAAGLATRGYRPVVAIYSTFLQRAFDQIIHDVALQKLPVIFALDRAGLVGDDGPTHHGAFDISYLRQIPNMTVMAPKDENELRRMLKTAEQHKEGPIAIRFPKGEGLGVKLVEELKAIPIGRGELLKEGKNITIVALGSMVAPAVAAAEKLTEEGITVTVINARFVKPIDKELILTAAWRSDKMVTVEENALAGGLGSAVLELLERNNLNNIKVKRLGLPDEFIEHGDNKSLKNKIGLNAEGIYNSCQELLKR